MTSGTPSTASSETPQLAIPQAVSDFLHCQGWGAVVTTGPLSGGMHSRTLRVQCQAGPSMILKRHVKATPPDGVYYREAEGLRVMVQPGGPRIPGVFAVGDDFILLEDLGEPKTDVSNLEWERFGQAVAMLHRCTNDRYGYHYSHEAASVDPDTRWTDDGVELWLSERILCFLSWPLIEETLTAQDRRDVEVYADVFRRLVPGDRPSLVHGDLWRANAMIMQSGESALFDPMASFGLRESDIAIAKQGRGIPDRFFDAYDEAYPLPEGWRGRLELYYLHIAIAMIAFVGSQPRYVEMLRELLHKFT